MAANTAAVRFTLSPQIFSAAPDSAEIKTVASFQSVRPALQAKKMGVETRFHSTIRQRYRKQWLKFMNACKSVPIPPPFLMKSHDQASV
ncbi:MAG: hypothetical protein LBU43_09660 [Candidatus Accumulibacter sp.]|nr:hypothetical protein [Accumulibacter sp.]